MKYFGGGKAKSPFETGELLEHCGFSHQHSEDVVVEPPVSR